MRTRLALLAFFFLTSLAFAQQSRVPEDLKGIWSASLDNSTNGAFFRLDIGQWQGPLRAAVLNGDERWPFTTAQFEDNTLTLRFDQYDGTLTAKWDPKKPEDLKGDYVRPYGKGTVVYPFHAIKLILRDRPFADFVSRDVNTELSLPFAKENPTPQVWGESQVRKPVSEKIAPANNLKGEWVYKLTNKDGKTSETGIAQLTVANTSRATGTLIPVSGDTGLLAGSAPISPVLGPSFFLSRFDGIHVLILTGSLQKDGSLKGTFESGKTGRYTFTATRKEATKKEDQPEDPFELTKVKDPKEVFQFSAPDPRTGKSVSASDPEFKNKVIIVDIMGTWCPNCHDEEPLLVDLYNRYHKDGLEIVSLSYEYTDDAARNARQIEIFRKKYNVPYPILIAGTTEDGQIAKTLPQLVGFGAYPTTIFVGREGRVSKIHAGYTGPATGERFPQVQKEMDQIVRDLLKVPAATAAR
jgi:thiol-disulfide isomerase/thioredoxin